MIIGGINVTLNVGTEDVNVKKVIMLFKKPLTLSITHFGNCRQKLWANYIGYNLSSFISPNFAGSV